MPSIFGKFFGRTVSEAAGVAAGLAVASPLRPVVQLVENETWALHPDRPVAVGDAAGIVAENVAAQDWGEEQASWTGYPKDSFDKLLGAALNAPGLPELLRLWRRDAISDGDFIHGLRKARFELRWDSPVEELRDERLDPAVIATAVQRGLLPNDGILPVGPPGGGGRVPPMPQVDLNPFTEAKASGITPNRLEVLARIVGLPAAPDLAARMVFRGIIERTDFDRAIAEGNTRNEWAPFLFDGFRQIVTAHDGVEGRLRGWLTDAEMYAQAARHGMSKADTDLLFKITGRPLSFHQVFIGERRGGTYDGPTAEIDPAFLKALQESNIRPEWYNLAWAQRHSYPSAFVLRALAQAGDLGTAADVAAILDKIGWPLDLAAKVSVKWVPTGTVSDPHVAKAQTQLWATAHRSYIADEIDDTAAGSALSALGVPGAAQGAILTLWQHERSLIRSQLSAAQVKKAYAEAVLNPATGAAWTQDEALQALVARGYSLDDALTLLEL